MFRRSKTTERDMALDGSQSHADAFGTVSGTATWAELCWGLCLVTRGLPGTMDWMPCRVCPRTTRRMLTTRDARAEKSKENETAWIA